MQSAQQQMEREFSKYSPFFSMTLSSNFLFKKSKTDTTIQGLKFYNSILGAGGEGGNSSYKLVSDLDSFANLQFWSYDRATWPLHLTPAVSLPHFFIKLIPWLITLFFFFLFYSCRLRLFILFYLISSLLSWYLYHIPFLPPELLWSQVLTSWQRD